MTVYVVHERAKQPDGSWSPEEPIARQEPFKEGRWYAVGSNAHGSIERRMVEYTRLERHPGTEVPPKDQWVLARYGNDSCIVFHDGSGWTDDGNDLDPPDEWVALSDVWGKR